ncbi:RNA polymerase sigma-70 factor, ECF subfamily [Chitinophaga jiangningensis]|uniref:RNA polymerase sigma-70 factor, ECF subfamily n=1 Tax=Chitinophaga jiangningensis TaxID=1419482 RepID=A0A1M7IZE2_9BACT|nr:sigma-70 family RNA polymerase sigma factor [Chitinophaga jiangningensis]SHM46140.1 RNA polymerase sigma-70 factor, ECF subfamily [Chitinophaga jiangningensis]
MNITEDRELFSRIASGDEYAFRLLYHRYNAVLAKGVKKMLRSDTAAAEVLQEVFLKVWLQRDTLVNIENPGGWLYTLAANFSLSQLRLQAREKVRTEDLPADDIQDNLDLSEKFYAKELQSILRDAIAALPVSRRQVFMMSMQDGKSRREIADALDISENTVKNQLLSARRFVREYLEQKTGNPLPLLLIALLLKIF